MKKGWESKPIGNIAEIMNGGTPDTAVPKYWDGANLWITPKDMGKLEGIFVDNTSRKITDEGLKNSSAKILPINSIILSSRAPIGHLAINRKPISTNQGCKGIVPKSGISPLYLYYFLSKSVDLLNSLGSGTTFKELSSAKLASVEIPIPSFPEQKCIVAILDEAFCAIAKAKANAEQNLKNAKELFESYLQSVFSDKLWTVKTIGDVCERVEYGSATKSIESGKVAVLRMGNIQNGRFVWDNLVYSDNEQDNSQYLLKYNDVLFNRTNSPELVGKTAIYKNEMPAIFAGYLIRIHRKENLLDADFLNYYLNSKMAMEYGKTVVISSVHQANINGTKLKGYPIPCPTLKEQKIIVKKLNVLSTETKKLESIYQQKLKVLEELKKSILKKAFEGEL